MPAGAAGCVLYRGAARTDHRDRAGARQTRRRRLRLLCGGFAEVGPEGATLQKALVGAAGELALVGPIPMES